MACTYNLWNALGGSPNTTGTWSQGIPNGGDCSDITAAGDPGAVSIDDTDPDYPEIATVDLDAVPSGTYHFTYVDGESGCLDCATVEITVNPGPEVVVEAISATYCTTNTNDLNIWDLFFDNSSSTNGIYVVADSTLLSTAAGLAGYRTAPAAAYGSGAPTPGQDVTDDEFRPSLLNPGTYTIKYRLNGGDGTTPGS